MKTIKITGLTGIIASVLMFIGDMLLYFSTETINNFDEGIIKILGQVSHERLTAGGLMGPLAAFLYIIGFYQIYLAIKPTHKKTAKIVFALLALGMIFGGTFHSHFTFIGHISSDNCEGVLQSAGNYIVLFFYIMSLANITAYLILAYLILNNKTNYPKWIILVFPITTFWLTGVVQMLPQPYLIIIAGGWTNIIHTVFFTASTLALTKKQNKTM